MANIPSRKRREHKMMCRGHQQQLNAAARVPAGLIEQAVLLASPVLPRVIEEIGRPG